MLAIFVLSSMSETPPLPDGFDKNLHALLYAGLAALLVRALAGGWFRTVTLLTVCSAVLIAAVYGVTDEIHQWFVPSRQPDVWDVVADTAGAALAAIVLYVWSHVRTASSRSRPV